MKRSQLVLSSICLIAASSCGQNAHVTARTPAPGAGSDSKVLTTAQVPGTVSWSMSDATSQDCPQSGKGVVLKKFIDQNGNGKRDPSEKVLESKTVCNGATGVVSAPAPAPAPALPPTLLSISTATPDQCANGGRVLESYLDLNANAQKDVQEPALTTGLVCNGDRGDGTQFAITDAPQGTCSMGAKGIVVAVSTTAAGAPPPNPSQMTFCEGPVRVTAIMPKINIRDAIKSDQECKFGGKVIELYYDANGNGRKDPLEFVASSAKECKKDPATEIVTSHLAPEDVKTLDDVKTQVAGIQQSVTQIQQLKAQIDADVTKADADAKQTGSDVAQAGQLLSQIQTAKADVQQAKQQASDAAQTQLKTFTELVTAKANEIAANLKALQDSPRTLSDLQQQAITAINQELEKSTSTLQQKGDAELAALDTKIKSIDSEAATVTADLGKSVLAFKNDVLTTITNAASIKTDADTLIQKIADEVTKGTGAISGAAADATKGVAAAGTQATSDLAGAATQARQDLGTDLTKAKTDLQNLIAPIPGMVMQMQTLSADFSTAKAGAQKDIQTLSDSIKQFVEDAQSKIPTIEELAQKKKDFDTIQTQVQNLVSSAQTATQTAAATSKQGLDDLRGQVTDLQGSFDKLKGTVDQEIEAKGTALDASLTTRIAALKDQLSGFQAKIDAFAGAEQKITELETDLKTIGNKVDEVKAHLPAVLGGGPSAPPPPQAEAPAAPPPPASAQECDVSRTLTDVAAIDRQTANGLLLPYDRAAIPVRDYGSPGESVPGTRDSMQLRRNRQELFQFDSKGIDALASGDLVPGSLKISMNLVLTKDLRDPAPYDYTEILCSIGATRACSGERFKDAKFSQYIVPSFWSTLPGNNVTTSLFSDELKAPEPAETRIVIKAKSGGTYDAFKRPLVINLGDAFGGEAEAYSLVWGDGGAVRPQLQFLVADDIRLSDASLTVSYKSKSCAVAR